MIVVDASVLVTALAVQGAEGDRARVRVMQDPSLHAPHVVDLEVISSLRRRAMTGDLDERGATFALTELDRLRMKRYPHTRFARRIWELRYNMTPYDAAYVALAEQLGCTFVTADRRLSSAAGSRCEIELLR